MDGRELGRLRLAVLGDRFRLRANVASRPDVESEILGSALGFASAASVRFVMEPATFFSRYNLNELQLLPICELLVFVVLSKVAKLARS